MSKIDKEYAELLRHILKDGYKYEDPNRKGEERIEVIDYKIKHNFEDGFPAISTKQLYWKGVCCELLWFMRGQTNIKYLIKDNINIWNKDAYAWRGKYNHPTLESYIASVKGSDKLQIKGDLGPVYGKQWRDWSRFPERDGVDQLTQLLINLENNPMGTRHIVTAWNPSEIKKMALPPCHWSFEILVEPLKFWDRVNLMYKPNAISTSGDLSLVRESLDAANIPKYQFTLKWHQRSVDTFLGLPFNIASYALLAQIIGKLVNMIPKGIIGDLSNVHIYKKHFNQVRKQLSRDVDKYPNIHLKENQEVNLLLSQFSQKSKNSGSKLYHNIDQVLKTFNHRDFKLNKYESYPSIKAEMLSVTN